MREHINDMSADTECSLVMHTKIACCHFRGQGQVFFRLRVQLDTDRVTPHNMVRTLSAV